MQKPERAMKTLKTLLYIDAAQFPCRHLFPACKPQHRQWLLQQFPSPTCSSGQSAASPASHVNPWKPPAAQKCTEKIGNILASEFISRNQKGKQIPSSHLSAPGKDVLNDGGGEGGGYPESPPWVPTPERFSNYHCKLQKASFQASQSTAGTTKPFPCVPWQTPCSPWQTAVLATWTEAHIHLKRSENVSQKALRSPGDKWDSIKIRKGEGSLLSIIFRECPYTEKDAMWECSR